jgi:hypothetical protein
VTIKFQTANFTSKQFTKQVLPTIGDTKNLNKPKAECFRSQSEEISEYFRHYQFKVKAPLKLMADNQPKKLQERAGESK